MILRELVQKIDKGIPLCVMKSPSGEIMFRRESVSDIIKIDNKYYVFTFTRSGDEIMKYELEFVS